MNRDEDETWGGGTNPNPTDEAVISSDDEAHELAVGASGFHQRLREKVSYYEQLSSPTTASRSGDGTGMCAGAEGRAIMDVDAFEERLSEERRRRMAESSPFLDVHLRSTPKLAKSKSNDSDSASPFNVKLRHWQQPTSADDSIESTTSFGSFQRTEITQRTERTITRQHTQHYVSHRLQSPSAEVFASVRNSQSKIRHNLEQWEQDVFTRTSCGNQRQHLDFVPRELSFDSVDSSMEHTHQPITIEHSVATANSNPIISTVVHLVPRADDDSNDPTTITDRTADRSSLFTSTATITANAADNNKNTILTSTHHHIKVGGGPTVATGNTPNNNLQHQQRLQQTLPVVPPAVARRSTISSSSSTHVGHVSPLASPGTGSTTTPTPSPTAEQPTSSSSSSSDWYQDYSAHSFQTAAARMNFKRTNSQYDSHIRQIRG